jgi:hypothetical protein
MADADPRTYRFSITVTVEADDPAVDDPEWIADAAMGVLANVYGYECFFDDIVELSVGEVRDSAITGDDE